MPYLLDSNTVIYARDGVPAVIAKFVQHQGSIFLSSLVLAELQRGLFKSNAQADLRRTRLEILLAEMPVISFDADAARAYGRILAQCGWSKGKDFDRMIAAHAISTRSVMITNNEADFAGIPGLVLENWMTG